MSVYRWDTMGILEDGCGGLIYKIIDRETSSLASIEISMCVFAPNEIAMRHYHKNMEEAYFVVEGEGEIELVDERIKIRTGDCVAIPRLAVHRINNTSSKDVLRFLSINSPSWQEDDMIQVEGPGK